MKRGLLLKCIAVPLPVGAMAALLTGGGMEAFAQMEKPLLSPPGWLFPIVWTVLYTLMGISSYLVIASGAELPKIYDFQLAVNFLWPTFFFNLEWYFFSFLWLILLWILVFIMILKFREIDKRAAWLNVPDLNWLTFAGYLNFAIWINSMIE